MSSHKNLFNYVYFFLFLSCLSACCKNGIATINYWFSTNNFDMYGGKLFLLARNVVMVAILL